MALVKNLLKGAFGIIAVILTVFSRAFPGPQFLSEFIS